MSRQSAANNLNNKQLQVLITGKFGDGSFNSNKRKSHKDTWNLNYCYKTNSIYKDYIEFKIKLLSSLVNTEIYSTLNRGYKLGNIYSIYTKYTSIITSLYNESLEDTLNKMDELGLALWIYDDGSLHKTKLFYNLNTQKYSKEINTNIIAPFLKRRFNITAIPTIERKKDGRIFWYLRIRKYDGAFIISEILNKYYVPCFHYKVISSETILKWSKLQEKLKSTDITKIHRRTLSTMLNKIVI